MKIILMLSNKIYEYSLPVQVSGSYSFDPSADEEIKLLQIEARDNKWILLSTSETTILDKQDIVKEIELKENNYYILMRNNKRHLLYVEPTIDENIEIYNYNQNSKIIIGNNPNSTILYKNNLLENRIIQISFNGNQRFITFDKPGFIYINNKEAKNGNIIYPGDKVNIYNFRMIILNNLIIMNNPNGLVQINQAAANLNKLDIKAEKSKNITIKDVDLYSKEDYFYKSPRMRRTIEEKEIKLDKPPSPKEGDKLPLLLTLGPMLSMGITSGLAMLNTLINISNGSATLKNSWMSIMTGSVMLLTSIFWPMLTKSYNRHLDKKNNRELYDKYLTYLNDKGIELEKEKTYQKSILLENLLSPLDCKKIIDTKRQGFWDKRRDQDDFLETRVGIGREELQIKVTLPEDGFSIEQDELKKIADNLVENYKYVDNVPIAYSFYENYITAVMGAEDKLHAFIDNMLLQIMAYYGYDEVKIMVFTTEENKKHWDYIKYSNYAFDNNRRVRYFATNIEEAKDLSDILLSELSFRAEAANGKDLENVTPYYLIINENYSETKKTSFFKTLLDSDVNLGYSTIILDKSINNLPSKCYNFINLTEGVSSILTNSYEQQEVKNFNDEIVHNIDMVEVTKKLSAIPIEIESAANRLPDAIAFLEMEKVGKVEQLNILNRWQSNDSTKSLKAEVGVDEEGNFMYLDLHEKYHGPHGLIAGMTGSGKSEFIITYILSMAMNYSPDDISFVLIDYKGGGLAFAFENKLTGVVLPHLAGTITNLDKAEMSRTLVSIDSELKRRQSLFNEARDKLGESTIDIYKYQGFFHDGKLTEPIPHLFLIADEFAELKSQQPDFMDSLISTARIGRSLGVHLILATQKPSGVVNDQIWSNTKFRVCLKVQDASDSNEMLKRPDAASLKQTGRFYLQVGFDEYFALGQSGWCGAKYIPSEKIIKQVDKSINFISNNGSVLKSIQAGDNQKQAEAQGEQLAAIMNEIIKISTEQNKKARRLWLENIPETILVDDVEKRYQVTHEPYNYSITIGEYDAPELQKQGIVKYDYLENGNTIIYGMDGAEKEKLLSTMIYSTAKNHSASEINYYIIDYGSESLRNVMRLPHMGGMVFAGDDERFDNLMKLIETEREERKKILVEYGGDYKNYLKMSQEKRPLMCVIVNNFDTMNENKPLLLDFFPDLVRDSERYGIVFIMTANSSRSVSSKINQNFKNSIVMHLKDSSDYSTMFSIRTKLVPRDYIGRGLFVDGDVIHEFQTASLVESVEQQNDFISNYVQECINNNQTKAKEIPALPEQVTLDVVKPYITNLSSVPIGICRDSLEPALINMEGLIGSLISSLKINNMLGFAKSLITVIKQMPTPKNIILFDPMSLLENIKGEVSEYYNDKYEEAFEKLNKDLEGLMEKEKPAEANSIIIILGVYKTLAKMDSNQKLNDLTEKLKKYEKLPLVVFEEPNKYKDYAFDPWVKNTMTGTNGLWIGRGMGDQGVIKYSNFTKIMNSDYKNDMGFFVEDSNAQLVKIIDFENKEEQKDE